MRYRVLLLTLVFVCLSGIGFTASPQSGKKIIEYGWDVPTTGFVRKHITEMERIPFDGVVIRVMSSPDERGDSLGWQVSSGKRFEAEQYEHAIKDLQATRFERFTDNFIQIIFAPGRGWFDPDWSAISHNAACLARVAKLGGCKGIMLDAEDYGSNIWFYQRLAEKEKTPHTYEQHVDQVRKRGSEFIRAVNAEYPDLTVFCLIGPSIRYASWDPGLDRYGLIYYFFEGMWEAASPGTIIVDGYEEAYGYNERQSFQYARKEIRTYARMAARDKKAYDRHISAGYGLWLDSDSARLGWHTNDFTKNYFTPDGFRASLFYALESSDKYVWVYSERLSWWKPDMPAAYINALKLAHVGPGPGQTRPKHKWNATASKDPTYSDDYTFADMRKTMTEVYDFPKDGWRFRVDPSDTGEKQGWYKTGFDGSKWRVISIGRFWEEQGVCKDQNYDGNAWYRLMFKAPVIPAGKRVFLAVGAADESAWVWLNGKYVNAHDIGGNGWNIPFTMDVTRFLKSGRDNVIAIKVLDRMQSGGLWKSLKLMVR